MLGSGVGTAGEAQTAAVSLPDAACASSSSLVRVRVRARVKVRVRVRVRVRPRLVPLRDLRVPLAQQRVAHGGHGDVCDGVERECGVEGGGEADHSGEHGARRQLREEGAWSGLGWGFGLKGCRVRVRVTVGLARLG